MSDYLWDKTGEADPEVEQLERLLGGFGHEPRPLELPAQVSTRPRRFRAARLAAAAALLLAVLAGALVALRFKGEESDAPVVETRAPREAGPARAARPDVDTSLPTPGRDAQLAAVGPERRERRDAETVNKFKPRRRSAALEKAGAESRVEAADAERLQAKEQLVYALRLTSAKLEEVRRKVQGDQTPPPAAEGRSRTR